MQMKTDNKITTKPLVIVGIVLITILLFCLVGCNNNVDNTPPTPNPPEPPHTHSYNANGICSCGQTRSIEVSLYIDGKYDQSIYTDSDCNYKITLPSTPEDIRTNPNSERYFYGWFADPNFQTPVTNKTTFNTNTKIYAKWITVYSNSFSYTVDYGKATITGYVGGTPTVLVIPAFINSFPVKKIGVNAFENETVIRTVIICDGIEEISGFKGCNSITEIFIPDSVKTIGESCFENCGFTKFDVPGNITAIEDNAFKGCSKLTDINIPHSVTKIDDGAFSDCISLKSFDIPNGITSIARRVFMNCKKLSKIIIPQGVTSIFNYAFSNCTNLVSVTLPDGLKYIDNETFNFCSSISNIEIPDSVTYIGWNAFQFCSSINNIKIPDNVTTIGDSAFSDCSGLTTVTIGKKVESLQYTFNNCVNLTSIIWNAKNCTEAGYYNGVKGIYYLAFGNCPKVKNIVIGNDVQTIPSYAFCKLGKITTVTIPGSVTYIGRSAFESCTELSTVNFNATNCTIEDHSAPFSNCKKLENVVIGNNVKSIPGYLFNECIGLKNITIPANITSIGNFAFNECSSLTSIAIPNSVTSIGDGAFCGCSSLTSITIPNSVTSIGSSTFSRCSSLESIVISDGVKTIGDFAFQRCHRLELTIPKSVTYIGRSVFYYAQNVKIYYQGSKSQWLNISKDRNWDEYATNLTIIYEE